jgi:pepF/M3 family oligoendopeptidase
MLQAARDAFPSFRKYLRAKAHCLGLEKLAFFDIFAPVGSAESSWPYGRAMDFVESNFRTYSDKLADFARRAFELEWIDAEPRAGKRDGAFCAQVRAGESRIMMNYKTAFGAVSTLAHELGHAYHNLCLAKMPPLLQSTPMTLAETASIFCETIVRRAALQELPPGERFAVLEASLQGATQVVVDISSRFLFERAVFDKRVERELSANELCDLMLRAQRETYGDGLDEANLHAYMWAAKPHYYGRGYYNFPYMFGLLFGLGLYAKYEADKDAFRAKYDDLLASTGTAYAADLAEQFDIDIKKADFWKGSLQVIEQDIESFCDLAISR